MLPWNTFIYPLNHNKWLHNYMDIPADLPDPVTYNIMNSVRIDDRVLPQILPRYRSQSLVCIKTQTGQLIDQCARTRWVL